MRTTLRRCILLGLAACAASSRAQTSSPPQPASGLAARNPAVPSGDPIEQIGQNGVSAPIVLFAPEPEYSKEGRKDKISGNVLLYLQVGTDGLPDHIRILRGIGYGLDEKAAEAVRQYKFKPASRNGVPVRVELNVQVNFQIYDKKP